jgi:hypothetical protein
MWLKILLSVPLLLILGENTAFLGTEVGCATRDLSTLVRGRVALVRIRQIGKLGSNYFPFISDAVLCVSGTHTLRSWARCVSMAGTTTKVDKSVSRASQHKAKYV